MEVRNKRLIQVRTGTTQYQVCTAVKTVGNYRVGNVCVAKDLQIAFLYQGLMDTSNLYIWGRKPRPAVLRQLRAVQREIRVQLCMDRDVLASRVGCTDVSPDCRRLLSCEVNFEIRSKSNRVKNSAVEFGIGQVEIRTCSGRQPAMLNDVEISSQLYGIERILTGSQLLRLLLRIGSTVHALPCATAGNSRTHRIATVSRRDLPSVEVRLKKHLPATGRR